MRLTSNRILVRKDPESEISAGGIILKTQQTQECSGVVLAVGPGKTNDNGVTVPCSVKPGDHVLVLRSAGFKLKLNGEELGLMQDNEPIVIFEAGESQAKCSYNNSKES
jgi:chaperonin GroES